MKSKHTIIHVEFHDGPRKGQHRYFGSIAAIFYNIPKKELKTTADSLYRFKITEEKPFKNKICIIRKGTVNRKPGNCTAPVKILRLQ